MLCKQCEDEKSSEQMFHQSLCLSCYVKESEPFVALASLELEKYLEQRKNIRVTWKGMVNARITKVKKATLQQMLLTDYKEIANNELAFRRLKGKI